LPGLAGVSCSSPRIGETHESWSRGNCVPRSRNLTTSTSTVQAYSTIADTAAQSFAQLRAARWPLFTEGVRGNHFFCPFADREIRRRSITKSGAFVGECIVSVANALGDLKNERLP
jgi:hypothetical protein